jgi:3-hydroxyanthranilate 3,4-dioxygenase
MTLADRSDRRAAVAGTRWLGADFDDGDERSVGMLFTIPSLQMPNMDLEGVMRQLTETGKRTQQLWLTADSMAFIARGREYRSEFHVNPSYEIQYSLRGDLNLHYRTEEGVEKIAFVPEGSCLFQPPLVPHSPRFAPDAFQLVIERARVPGDIDRFLWFCPSCDHFLHEETYVVDDYRADPVTQAYRNFYDSEEFRTCKKCGTIMPAPAAL